MPLACTHHDDHDHALTHRSPLHAWGQVGWAVGSVARVRLGSGPGPRSVSPRSGVVGRMGEVRCNPWSW